MRCGFFVLLTPRVTLHQIPASSDDSVRQKIKFDEVAEEILEPGNDMNGKYREAGRVGLVLCSTCG